MHSILMFGSVGGIREGLATVGEIARVLLFIFVCSEMCLQILKTGVRLATSIPLNKANYIETCLTYITFVGFVASVRQHM